MGLKSDVVVLGAGAVGVSAALHLQARGRSVTLVDRLGGVARETSYGNSGIVQSEAVFPYTFPREPLEVINAGLNRDPRVNIRYSALPSIAPFVFRYFLASSPAARLKSSRGLRKLVAKCVEEHLVLAEAAGARSLLRDGGWIKVFRTPRGRDGGMRDAEEVAPYGVTFRPLTREQVLELEPHVGAAAIGGVHFSDPLTTPDPEALIASYAELFLRRGGRLVKGDAATLQASGAAWRVTTDAGAIEAREVVLALGPWTDAVARSLGYRFPFGVKRGYHMHYAPRGNQGLTRPVLDLEKGYLVTPMAKGLRLTTGAEFARADDPPSSAHLDRLEPFGKEMFPLGDRLESEPWLGRRPCLPDMLPVIGPAPRHKGLWFDFGHHHLGLTLGPVSGRLIAEMMTGAAPCVDPAPYAAGRF
jgi:D-amino-acid dehydrogenase